MPVFDLDKYDQKGLIELIEKLRALRENLKGRFVERAVIQDYQRPFFASQKKQRTISGGHRAGKTWCMVQDLAYYAHRCHPYRTVPRHPLHMRYCTVDFELFDTVVMPYLKMFFDERILYGRKWQHAVSRRQGNISKIHFADGGFLQIMTYNQDVQSYQGGQFDWIGMDEPCPNYDIYKENWMRTTERRGCLVNGFTIWSKYGAVTWEKELWEKANDPETESLYDFFEMSMLENAFISAEAKLEICAGLTPKEYQARILGKAIHMSDLVYHRYERGVNVIKPFKIPQSWPRIIIMDLHDIKPHAVTWIAVNDVDECFVYRGIKKSGIVSDLVKTIRVLTQNEPVALWVVDPSARKQARNRTVEDRSFMFQLRECGLDEVTEGNVDDKAANILKVNEMLTPDSVNSRPQLFIFDTLELGNRQDKENWNVIDEIENYIYITSRLADARKDTKETRDKWDDHCVNLRMLAALNPQYRYLVPLHRQTRTRAESLWEPEVKSDDLEYHTNIIARPKAKRLSRFEFEGYES